MGKPIIHTVEDALAVYFTSGYLMTSSAPGTAVRMTCLTALSVRLTAGGKVVMYASTVLKSVLAIVVFLQGGFRGTFDGGLQDHGVVGEFVPGSLGSGAVGDIAPHFGPLRHCMVRQVQKNMICAITVVIKPTAGAAVGWAANRNDDFRSDRPAMVPGVVLRDDPGCEIDIVGNVSQSARYEIKPQIDVRKGCVEPPRRGNSQCATNELDRESVTIGLLGPFLRAWIA